MKTKMEEDQETSKLIAYLKTKNCKERNSLLIHQSVYLFKPISFMALNLLELLQIKYV